MNTFGRKFRVTVFGESHGEAIGVVLDGVPAGLELCEADLKMIFFVARAERRVPLHDLSQMHRRS